MINIYLKDSMATIQSKLNKGGSVQFQTGTYRITKQLSIPAGTRIDLNGAILQRCANIQSIFINKTSANTTGYSGAGNILIENGTLEAMGRYNPDNLLTLFHSHDVSIIAITFLDNLCHAIEVNSSNGIRIEGCHFLGYNSPEPYKEMIQIDAAFPVGFRRSGTTIKSKCYDGTMCQDICIICCEFDKSKNRGYPTACIGTHNQLQDGKQHSNISIAENQFTCNGEQSCLSLIGMKNVGIYRNTFKNGGKAARIYSKEYSYSNSGERVKSKENDGKCTSVHFLDNKGNGYIYKYTEPKKKYKIKGELVLC